MSQLALVLFSIIVALVLVLTALRVRHIVRLARSRPALTFRPGTVLGFRKARRHERPGIYPIFAMAGGSAPVIPALSANTVARKYVLEVDLANNILAPNYTPAGGMKNFTFVSDDANLEDDRRFSDAGYNRQNKTGTGWNATATFSRAPKSTLTTAYDDVQEFLRAHGEGKIGTSAQVNVRFYEFDPDATLPRVQAYAGTALVTWNEPNGGPTDNSDATVTLTGQGQLLTPSHPYPATASVPVLTSATPGTSGTIGTAGGVIVRIRGTHMAGTTAVTFGGTTATSITNVDDSLVIVIAPAKTAGSQNLVVTNATGASTALPVTYA